MLHNKYYMSKTYDEQCAWPLQSQKLICELNVRGVNYGLEFCEGSVVGSREKGLRKMLLSFESQAPKKWR